MTPAEIAILVSMVEGKTPMRKGLQIPVINTLGESGARATGALPGLEALLNDQDPAVAAAAEKAIDKIRQATASPPTAPQP